MPLASAPFLLPGEVVASPGDAAARFNVIVVAVGLGVGFRLLPRIDEALFRQFALVLLFASLLTNRLRDYNSPDGDAGRDRNRPDHEPATRRRRLGRDRRRGRQHAGRDRRARRRRRGRGAPPSSAFALLCVKSPPARSCSRPGSGEAARSRRYAGDHGIRTVLPYSGRAGFSTLLFGLLSIVFSFGRGARLLHADCCSGWRADAPARARRASLHRADARVRRGPDLGLREVVGLVRRVVMGAALPSSPPCRPRRSPASGSGIPVSLAGGHPACRRCPDASRVGRRERRRHRPLGLGFCAQDDYALESLCWYTPEYSPLWRPLVDFPDLSTSTAVVAAYRARVCVPRRAALRRARRVADRAAGSVAHSGLAPVSLRCRHDPQSPRIA